MQKFVSFILKLTVIFCLFSLFPTSADPCDEPHWIYGGYTDSSGTITLFPPPPVTTYNTIDFEGVNENSQTQKVTFIFNATTGNTQQQAQTIINAGSGTLIEFYWEIIEGKAYAIICDPIYV